MVEEAGVEDRQKDEDPDVALAREDVVLGHAGGQRLARACVVVAA